MKRIFSLIILATTLSLQAAAPPRGSDRLRELVVFPEMNLNFNFGINFQCGEWVVSQDTVTEVSRLREELKRQPESAELFLELGNLVETDGKTNESKVSYEIAEQLCRKRMTATPQDGLAFTELGKSLWQLDKNEEAESAYRKAVLVSSNEWRCWVGLGNFLACYSFPMMFPEKLRCRITYGPQPPPQEILDYPPSPEALKKVETSLSEASRCFDRAVALAPKEPDAFFQRAGFVCVSNWENCFFRHYHNNEEIAVSQWSLAVFSEETIANLQKAADLNPKNYELISTAAYFEWIRALVIAKWPSNYTVDMLPDKTKQSIHDAVNHLRNILNNSDEKTAAGAFENLGILNMAFGNKTEARSDFQRAVALDPTREASWDMLLGTLVTLKASPGEMVSVCQSRLKHDNSAQNHLLLAKALVKEEKWDEAAIQAGIADRIETNNIVPPLFIAAIALKDTASTNYLTTAIIYMKRANAVLQTMPASENTRQRWREFSLNAAILSALDSQAEKAKQWADLVLKQFPDDETARKILAALD